MEAVRLMETQEADEIIARHINHEKEPAWGVRVSAVKAASTRSKADPIMSALLKAASDDPELKAKKEVRKLLFSWSRDNPELTAKLEEIAEADERAEEGNL